MQQELFISLEFTPNPNTLKYAINRKLIEKGAVHFTSREQAEVRSPLAHRLFAIEGIAAVMIGVDFVTVTKSESGDWENVHQKTSELLKTHLNSGEAIIAESSTSGESGSASAAFGANHSQVESDLEQKIVEILDREIRPAVAMDGGDITFDHYADGIVYLQLKGSCQGCPSSTATLKIGIETRLKEQIPEVQEVVAV